MAVNSELANSNISAKHHVLLLDTNDYNSKNENPEMELDGSIISLEFAPLTKGIKISNIPQDTSPDDIKFQFSNPNIDGGKMTDMMWDRNNDIVIVYFEKSSGRILVYSAEGKMLSCY